MPKPSCNAQRHHEFADLSANRISEILSIGSNLRLRLFVRDPPRRGPTTAATRLPVRCRAEPVPAVH
jgi:hypothetical protein